MIPFNLKIAVRNIRKNKVFSAINILGLALGMACCLVIALYIWNESGYDRFHRHFNRIARITERQNQGGNFFSVAVTPGPLAPALERDFPEIAATVRLGQWSGLLKNGNATFEEKNIQLTENSIFKIFDFPLLKGNTATALRSPDDIIISEKLADKYFNKNWRNNNFVLGQVFRLNNEHNFKLAGIAKNVPENSSIQFDVLLPLQFLFNTDEWSDKWNSNNYHSYIQFKPGVDQKAFEKKIAGQLTKYHPETQDQLRLQPLAEQYLQSSFDFKTDWGKRNSIKYINIFAGVGLLLLTIACFNFVNLSTARSLQRAMEVGVRKANGASRRQLIFQFLSESTLMAFASGLLAIMIVNIAQPWLQSITGKLMENSLSNIILLSLFAGCMVVIGILAGLYPAFLLSAFNPAKVFNKVRVAGSGKVFRQSLVVIQFAIAGSLIIVTLFMYRQMRFIRQKDLGFDKEQVVSIRLGGGLSQKSASFKQQVDKLSGVIATSPATMSLANVDNSSYIEWEGMLPEDKFLITQANIDPGFIPTLKLQLLKGNNFSTQFSNDTANYIVNESAVRRMGFTLGNVIGKELNFWGAKGKIIGVVKDFHFKPLHNGIEPFIFRYQPQERYFNLLVKLSAGATPVTLQQIQKIYTAHEADSPFEFSFLNESIDKLYAEEKRTSSVIFLFSGLTIFVACLGLFGLAVFAAEQRVKEIGVRKVLGAGIMSITFMMSKDFLRLVIIGIMVAVPAAGYITHLWLQQYAYRVRLDAWIFVVTSLAVMAIAGLTVCFQAIKSANVNPVKCLRTD